MAIAETIIQIVPATSDLAKIYSASVPEPREDDIAELKDFCRPFPEPTVPPKGYIEARAQGLALEALQRAVNANKR